MNSSKYLFIYRSGPQSTKPTPSQMQEMFAAFNSWKDKFKDQILDMGDKLKPSGKVVSSAGVTDGPFAESKEIIAGYMIVLAKGYEQALQVAEEMPGSKNPGSSVEIREMAGMQG